MRGLFCLRHAPRNPTSTTRFIRPTSSCSAANHPEYRSRCIRPPMPDWLSRCGRACARSMWRWLRPWQLEKRCGRRLRHRSPAVALTKKYETGEGQSHAPGRYPSPASLAGAGRLNPVAKSPRQAEGDITLPDPPHPQGSPKEWQNIASRVEFLVCPHENGSAKAHASTTATRVQKQRHKIAGCLAQLTPAESKCLRITLRLNDRRQPDGPHARASQAAHAHMV